MRLIDADSLKNKMLSHAPIIVDDFYKILNFIDEAPTVERPHGEWKNTRPQYMSDNIVCSVCGYDSIAEYNYCPNCGSDNRKKAERKHG